jgi:hypothetical protein
MVQTHRLAHLRQEALVAVRMVHPDRSQIQASISNQHQALEAHKTLINQLEVNQYLQEPHQQMLPVEQTY